MWWIYFSKGFCCLVRPADRNSGDFIEDLSRKAQYFIAGHLWPILVHSLYHFIQSFELVDKLWVYALHLPIFGNILISRRLQLSANALKSVRWAHSWSLRISLTLRFSPLTSIARISPKNATDSFHRLPRTLVHFSKTRWSRQAVRLNHCHGHLWSHQIIASSGPCAIDALSTWSTNPIRTCSGKVYVRSSHYRCFASSGIFLIDQVPTSCQKLLLDSLNWQRLLFVPFRHFLETTHLQV